MATRQDFETRFSQAGKEIDELVADAREEYREERQELKDKWSALDTKKNNLADDTEETWNDVKDEMEEGWNDVKASYDDLKRRLAD
jgi:gas vesicle protein